MEVWGEAGLRPVVFPAIAPRPVGRGRAKTPPVGGAFAWDPPVPERVEGPVLKIIPGFLRFVPILVWGRKKAAIMVDIWRK
jgi:hypothetical protein